MNSRNLFSLVMCVLLGSTLFGCGGSSREGGGGASSANLTASAPCMGCHAGTYSNTDPVKAVTIVDAYTASAHSKSAHGPACNGCHTNAILSASGGKHDTLTWSDASASGVCQTCHYDASPYMTALAHKDPNTLLASPGFDKSCNSCHNSHNPATFYNAGCVNCHAVGMNAGLAYDNDGVRPITTEFGKWSHHVTGVTLDNAHCAACHLAGTVKNGYLSVDKTKHAVDDIVHLRNADSDADILWDPTNPNHTNMDNFCMSCHDANGATSPISVAVQAVINKIPVGAGRAATAAPLNPFGDTISNQYDQLSRGAVVAVKEQFDQGNTSHHGVRAARYGKTALSPSELNAVAAANLANGEVIAATASATVGTLYETSKLTAYKPFGSTTAIADNSNLHCADCHTVGQWKANTTNVITDAGALGAAVPTVIGAHGSNNEYMLRNQDGSDSTTASRTQMVCYICHISNQYDGYTGLATDPTHNGSMNHSLSATITKYTGTDANCNGNGNNTMGKVLVNYTSTRLGITAANQALIALGKYGTSGSSNPFANKCLNCHNASDKKTFGGIHGNAFRVGASTTVTMNAGYTSYSGASGAAAANPLALTAVNRKPYRFLPGLGNFRYNGGADSNAWTRRTMGALNQSQRMGCYTLNGASSKRVAGLNPSGTAPFGVDYIPSPAPTKAVASGTNVSPNAIADDNGILGSWGGCAHHAGGSASGATAPARTSLRPLTY